MRPWVEHGFGGRNSNDWSLPNTKRILLWTSKCLGNMRRRSRLGRSLSWTWVSSTPFVNFTTLFRTRNPWSRYMITLSTPKLVGEGLTSFCFKRKSWLLSELLIRNKELLEAPKGVSSVEVPALVTSDDAPTYLTLAIAPRILLQLIPLWEYSLGFCILHLLFFFFLSGTFSCSFYVMNSFVIWNTISIYDSSCTSFFLYIIYFMFLTFSTERDRQHKWVWQI